MQIDGMREFFSKIALLNEVVDVQRNSLLSALPALAQQTQPAHDSLLLSDLGKKLSLDGRESSSLIKKRNAELAEIASLPSWAQEADKAMAKAIDILERMQKLAIAAQDKKLSDIDRVEMQIEIEDLRANLAVMPMNMRGGPQIARLPAFDPESWKGEYGDYSSVLGRMRERIMNGQEWDVREAWCPDGFTRLTYDDNGEEVWEIVEAKAWYVVDDKNVKTRREGKVVDSGEKVLTAREILELETPVVVMDTESAVKGAQYLEKQIASIQKWRDELPENLERLSMEHAIAFLETIAVPGGVFRSPLTDPTRTGTFLFSDGIYDNRYSARPEDRGGSDIPLTDGEIMKNSLVGEGWVNKGDDEKIVGYAGPKLREEYITPLPLTEPKEIYVKGIRALTK